MLINKSGAFFFTFLFLTPSVHPVTDFDIKVEIGALSLCLGVMGALVYACHPKKVKTTYGTLNSTSKTFVEKYAKELNALYQEYPTVQIYSSLTAVKQLDIDIQQLQNEMSDISRRYHTLVTPEERFLTEKAIQRAQDTLSLLTAVYIFMITDPQYETDLDNERAWQRWSSPTSFSSFSPAPTCKKRNKNEPVTEPTKKTASKEEAPQITRSSTSIFDFSHGAADL